MKQLIKNIFLSLVLIVGTIGIVANAHVCQGMLKAINLEPSHECCEMSMDMKEKTDCCDNQAKQVKIDSHYDQVIDVIEVPSYTYQEAISNLWTSVYSFILPENSLKLQTPTQFVFCEVKSPPIYLSIAINVAHKVFIV
ncbi:HYC_CC_PP family protein [Flammeovirga kamogawensis]|uniref:Uncharacterized protein n=1 Tax=Flammeovirga kamogawensis TaxID=373891 RepID=A0ABX8GW26_9BACT|nr:hypothetical protein [Flammeovirga kamogawensis]MBB6461242.1 hypothetical protein [Flammeovirga kamogawensis]QWG07801.1 hypothetical protein KM029_02350 [Flammeovirga kamogawensis]TRX69607.1 hypothetical protein EO216_16285 [Flammeovirga kamogawensis]